MAPVETLSGADYFVIYLYLLAILISGLLRRQRSADAAEDYVLAGRQVTLPAFVASLVSTWYGGILGVGEFSYNAGLANWLVFGVPYYIYALIFALFIARQARRSANFTIPEQLERSYGRPASLAGAFFIYILVLPAPYLLMLGMLLQMIFDLPAWLAVIAAAIYSTMYIYRSGLAGVVRTDIIQFLLMFAGFILLVFAAFQNYGGLAFLRAHVPAGHFTWNGGNSVQFILVWYLIAAATLVDANFFQRCFAARTESVARNGILISIGFWILFDFLTTSAGLYARAILPDLPQPAQSYPQLALTLLPKVARGLFFVALLATVMSTLDSFTFVAAVTLGRDFAAKLRLAPRRLPENRLIQMAMIVTMLITCGIAMASDSIVALWYQLGSISTPALLLPLATSFTHRWKMRPAFAAANIIVAGGLSLGWVLGGSGMGGYWLGVEPIYPGLAVSFMLFLWDRRSRRREARDV